MHFWTSLQVLLLALSMSPEQKARVVVVTTERPGVFYGAAGIRFADQEGGLVKAFPTAPPTRAAADFTTPREAFAAGAATRRALHRKSVDVDLAPVLDAPDGPLGARHFRSADYGVAFARGLLDAGESACVKHFPGLGSAGVSTDDRPHVAAHVRDWEVATFAAAVHAGVPCVMTSNAFYDGAPFRATISQDTYRRLRALGFDGVAITDSLSIVRKAPVERWSRQAVRAGADLVLFTSPAHARRALRALQPLARAGELDEHIRRVLAFRARAIIR